jgi:hypothetical protein
MLATATTSKGRCSGRSANPGSRRRCHAGLNKSEQRHFLAQVICTSKQGRIADRGAEAQQFHAPGVNLVIAAILFWNSSTSPTPSPPPQSRAICTVVAYHSNP